MKAQILLAACVVSCASAVRAQVPPGPGGFVPGPPRAQMPARDTPTPATGTARIRGRVIAADTGQPLRRAHVRVAAADVRLMRVAMTDAEGRYEFTGLPTGRYTIFVARNGYVTLQFGQQRPFEPGRPLDVADAQVHDRIDFALPRGGVIAGRVTDELGEPLAGVRMTALRHRYMPTGERQLMPANPGGMFNIVTNDLGEFRVFGLMPGAYLLSADPDDGGFMSIQGGMMPPGASSGETDGYATTYYPGTASSDEAQPITVGLAEVATASFALSSARLAQINGIVRNSAGAPTGGVRVALRVRVGMGGFSRGGPPTGPDGRFSISGVPPGDYTIDVMPMMLRPGAAELGESGSLPVTVAGRDVTDVVITTSPGATITGQVIFQGKSTASRPDRVVLQSVDPQAFRPGMNDGDIDSEGRFQLRGAAGRALFRTVQRLPAGGGPGSGWQLKSVMLNGADITDTPLDITAVGDVSGLEIVLTDMSTTISGTVTNLQRAPIKDYVVAIFPDRLKEGVVPMRFIRTARPDQQGRFETRGLPSGEYFAVALPTLETGEEWDPEFRKRVEPRGRRFRLNDGQSTTIDLQLQE